jgi:hypothetical protein
MLGDKLGLAQGWELYLEEGKKSQRVNNLALLKSREICIWKVKHALTNIFDESIRQKKDISPFLYTCTRAFVLRWFLKEYF